MLDSACATQRASAGVGARVATHTCAPVAPVAPVAWRSSGVYTRSVHEGLCSGAHHDGVAQQQQLVATLLRYDAAQALFGLRAPCNARRSVWCGVALPNSNNHTAVCVLVRSV